MGGVYVGKFTIFCMSSLVSFLTLGLLAGCASNPHEANKIDTTLENKSDVIDESIGVKDGNMVVQKKVLMAEELRNLQYSVYELEDRVYGNRKFGSKGLYGVFKQCRMELSDKANGGTGKLNWLEPLDRVTDKEDKFEIGLDDKDQIVGINDEFLKDRIKRFKRYKGILMKREDGFNEKIDICKAELKSRKHDSQKADVSN